MRGLMLFLVGVVLIYSITADTVPYSAKLYYEIAREKRHENVIFSPTSIKTLLGLAYLGAEGDTAKEIYDAFQFSGNTKEEVGENFREYFRKLKESGVDLKSANRIYLAERYSLAPKYNELVSKYFNSETQNINFAESSSAAKVINSWVESQTNNKIHELISPDVLDSTTSAVLLNAVYFKATWKYQFKPENVNELDFFLSKDKTVKTKLMHETFTLDYGEIPELNARIVELPYANTDIHFLIILPNDVEGLSALEEKLKGVDLNSLTTRRTKVNLLFPKFKFDFAVPLNQVLVKLGLQKLFTNGDFSGITSSSEPLSFSNVLHKAFIEVDEKGTEAAAASAATLSRIAPSAREIPVEFFVNHPFFFAIKDKDTVYFAGHVAKF